METLKDIDKLVAEKVLDNFGGERNSKARWFFWRNNIGGKFVQYGEVDTLLEKLT